jgi:putative nucleotidyltransferase with HDIG domain
MEMLDHIVVHSMQVCRVATLLTENLIDQGIDLNFDLIQAAGLLHDITKTHSFQTKENHALTGGQFLAARGFSEVGSLVGQHVRLDEYPNPAIVSEAAIINYADKRVLHDKVVSLEKRLDYILGKYAKVPEHRKRIYWLWEKTKEIEDVIFSALSYSPGYLIGLINSEDRSLDFQEYQKVCKDK